MAISGTTGRIFSGYQNDGRLMPDRHKHQPITFRPSDSDRARLLDYVERTGEPLRKVLAQALTAFLDRVNGVTTERGDSTDGDTTSPEAITAAAVAIHDADCPDTRCSGSALGHYYKLARAALAAAAPHIGAPMVAKSPKPPADRKAAGKSGTNEKACKHPGVGRKQRCPECRRYNV